VLRLGELAFDLLERLAELLERAPAGCDAGILDCR
jgi:hypothetical protein